MPDIISAGGFPFPHVLYQSGLDGILVYIFHHIKIFPLVFNDPGEKPFTPEMIRRTVYTVPAFSRMGLDPVHNLRKVSPFARYDEQVYVGRHDTKIGKGETELFFRVLKDQEHGFSPYITLKNPLFIIGP
jgi:hypothetical protein